MNVKRVTASNVIMVLITLFFSIQSEASTLCDVDGNGVVNHDDTYLINVALNTPADPGDPRDYNADGVIEYIDYRYCTRLCTYRGCGSTASSPSILSSPVREARVGTLYQYAVEAVDPEGGDITFDLLNSPEGMSVDSEGLISWTPDAVTELTSQFVSLRVLATNGAFGGQDYMITVSAANQAPQLSITSPTDGAVFVIGDVLTLTATATDSEDGDLSGSIQWRSSLDGALGSGDNLDVSLNIGTHALTGEVFDSEVVSATDSITITVLNSTTELDLPPDPSSVAPPLATTELTSLKSATEFLYTGADPIQTGVAAGTIEEERVAIVRGTILDRSGSPLSGVTLSIKDHPEYGQTLSRADGVFDLAVNGGGQLVINYEKAGYLPVQRPITTDWQDYHWAEDVVLIPLDNAATVVDFSNPSVTQVARGSVVTDNDGSRQATVLFPPGVTGVMEMADGSTVPLTTATVRATEYTIGDNGPQSMPGALPPTSGYTYAVELSLDEAIAAGASDVQFDQPVSVYVENFLDFPVGGIVPVGWYDREKAAWIPSDNGLVIQILSVTSNLADIDVDGSGTPADATTLVALNITEEERAQLATLYLPGDSLWYASVSHFTPYDLNWPMGPPDDAESPNQPAPDTDEPEEDPDCEGGSIVECQNAVLRERVPVTGTPFTLNYRSDWVPGRKAAYSLDMALSGSSIPASLRRIDLKVSVAGRHFYQSFAAQPDLHHVFTWDGKDAYGRKVLGKRTAIVSIEYVYPGIYKKPIPTGSSFARPGIEIVDSGNRREVIVAIVQQFAKKIGVNSVIGSGLGDWSLSSHNSYDSSVNTVHYGDGTIATFPGLTVDTIAGSAQGFSGDGGLAKDARLTRPKGVVAGPDGSVYFSDNNLRVRRIDPDGIITTVAGSGSYSYSGDGGPAIQAGIRPQGLAVGSDGSLYIADTFNRRVRRVGPDGIITTVAGNGTDNFTGDGGPAVETGVGKVLSIAIGSDDSLYFIGNFGGGDGLIFHVGVDGNINKIAGGGSGLDGGPAIEAYFSNPTGIAVGSDGSLYIADSWHHRIRRIGPDGIITTVAGSGGSGYSGDGDPAIEARLNTPMDVAIGLDGSIYISDYSNKCVRRVRPDGIITAITGGCGLASSGADGPAGLASARPYALSVGQKGIYLANDFYNKIRLISGSFGIDIGENSVGVPSEDGLQLHVFESTGRLSRTEDTTTGATLYQFHYNADGLLTGIEDGNQNLTTIDRYSDGAPVAIIAPEGQRTELLLDANGYLSSITNPNNESHNMVYTVDGLLTSFTDPRNNTSVISYETDGRLKTDINAAGGGWTLDRTEFANGHEVTMTSQEGRTTHYRVEQLPTGESQRTNTYPNGTTSSSLEMPGTQKTSTATDGTVTVTSLGADPRFGAAVPMAASKQVTTLGGLTSTITTDRTAILAVENDPLSHTQLTEVVAVNGRTYSKIFDKSTLTYTTTSPEGRQYTTVLDAQGRTSQILVPGLNALSYAYDAKGRLGSVTHGSRTTDLAYNGDGNLYTVTDAELQQVAYQYDLAGRVTKKTRIDDKLIQYAYDDNGSMTGITPAGKHLHSYEYNTINLQSSYIPPDVVGVIDPSTAYYYNLDKQLKQVVQPDGQIDVTYHAATGQKLSMQTPDGNYAYGYHPTTGQLTSITAPGNNTLAMSYDGFLPTGNNWTGTVQGSVSRTFDNDFATATESVNGSFSVTYQYDNDKLLASVGSLSISRDVQNGLISGTGLGNLSTNRGYNGYVELSDYSADYNTTALYDVIYTRDNIGRITQQQQTLQGTTTTWDYFYDAAGRLDEVKTNDMTTVTYTFDDNGNRTHVNGAIVASYDDQDRLSQYGSTTYSYTDNGALLSKTDTASSQTTTYNHDLIGNLRQVNLPGGVTVDYVIDGTNRRIGKKVNGTLQQGFLYKDQLNPVAELDSTNNVVARFVYGDKPYVPAYMEKGGVTYRIISDHLGSPRLVVNMSDGSIAQKMDYDVWGNVTADTNPEFQPFGYAGGIYDQHTKLVKFGARDYDPAIGRWIQKDPIGLDGGLNTYEYVGNNPVMYTDPYGLFDVRRFILRTIIQNAVNGLVGASALGIGALWYTSPMACQDFDCDFDGDGIPDNLLPEPPETDNEDDSDGNSCPISN